MVSSPWPSTSSIAQALLSSSILISKPKLDMVCCMVVSSMRDWNSSLSSVPLPSVSASLKLLRKNSMNAFCLRSCSSLCSSLRLVVAAIISSEATPVSTEISVQEAKAMNATKNRRSCGEPRVKGPAIWFQLSCVTTRKRVKSEMRTDWNCSFATAFSSELSWSSDTESRMWLLFTKSCTKMAEASKKRKSTKKTQVKAPSIDTKAERKAVSFGSSLKMRIARQSRMSRSVSMASLCLPKAGATTQRSTTPNTTRPVSRMFHR
mmetsp:Transcript_132572/g.412188  ORF Transcript_132572/g.412188 Transcript_132572/m.412188 type:complete len:263 (-) Transcript_132572:422-1210(-)